MRQAGASWASLGAVGVLVGCLGIAPPRMLGQSPRPTPTASPTSVGTLSPAAARACNFSRQIPLRSTSQYGLLGNDTFDTLVCGYLVIKQEDVLGEAITTAYLRILRFQDSQFQKAMAREVAQGNSVNSVANGVYDFNLGT
jgi:hypothetical protein